MTIAQPRSPKYKTYDDIIWNTERPIAERRRLFIGRRGESIIPRRFHLTVDQIEVLRAQYLKHRRIPNPHSKGCYFYLIEALVGLGINKCHSMSAVIDRVRTLMSDHTTIQPWNGSTAWDRWVSDTPRDKRLKNNWQARFEINVRVLQRLNGFNPYGRKLLDVGKKIMKRKGAVIDLLRRDGGEKCIRLNTKSDLPRNDFKTRGIGSRT